MEKMTFMIGYATNQDDSIIIPVEVFLSTIHYGDVEQAKKTLEIAKRKVKFDCRIYKLTPVTI